MNLPPALAVEEVAALRQAGEKFHLLDVREDDEVLTAKIAGSMHIPMADIPVEVLSRLPDKDARIVAYCHHGMRSQRIVEYLRHLGYGNVQNMTGGIDEWSLKIDPAVARY